MFVFIEVRLYQATHDFKKKMITMSYHQLQTWFLKNHMLGMLVIQSWNFNARTTSDQKKERDKVLTINQVDGALSRLSSFSYGAVFVLKVRV